MFYRIEGAVFIAQELSTDLRAVKRLIPAGENKLGEKVKYELGMFSESTLQLKCKGKIFKDSGNVGLGNFDLLYSARWCSHVTS